MHGQPLDPRVTAAVTWLAACLALFIALIVPAAFYLAGRSGIVSSLQAHAGVGSIVVSEIAMASPELWVFEGARLQGRLSLIGATSDAEERRVLDGAGRIVARHGQVLDSWTASAAEPIYDSGVVIGRIEVVRSLHPLLVRTAWVALCAAALAVSTFGILRLLPLRLLRSAVVHASYLATHDAPTGLPNRRLFLDRLHQALCRLPRDGQALAVMCVDLDQFKQVNDMLGHGAGDLLLDKATRRLRACLRETDTLASLGVDAFAILQVGTSRDADAAALATRLIGAMGDPFDLNGSQVCVGVSIGISVRPSSSTGRPEDGAGILQEAEIARHQAKMEGRGTYRFFQADMNEKLRERRLLDSDLRNALALQQFELVYQPQLSLAGRCILGAEALIRWRHPRRGLVRPDMFIGLAEENGLIAPIGTWVMREACREATGWAAPLRIAVNVSPVQFRRPDFVAEVAAALADSGLAAARLELEVTEGILLSDTEGTLATLRRLRALGVSIAMDDFGTGYSSLGYLQKFPFDKIKIDKSFVSGLGTDPGATAIIGAILGMAGALHIRVNAEGVENEHQALLLQQGQCDEVQGFLFSRPVGPAAFRALLLDGHPAAPGIADIAKAG